MATARDKASAPSPSSLDALERRVAALEGEREMLMERYARQLEFDNQLLGRLRSSGPDVALASRPFIDAVRSGEAAPDSAVAAAPGSAAAMLARVLGGVEGQVDDVERLAAAGELTSAVDTALQATRRSAAALRATLADAELRESLVTSMTPLNPPPRPPSIENYAIPVGGDEPVPFRVAEIAVLQMAGLRRSLAEKHVDAAIAEYKQSEPPRPSVDLHQVLDRIEAVQRAVAHAETVLPFVVNQPPQRLKWRKLVTFGLGGTLIVAANAGAVVILGPVAAAVSAAVGSAAIGAAAAPLVM
jgi:hypothetical protein